MTEKELRIRVVANGWSASQCDVYDADTGEKLTNIKRVSFDVSRLPSIHPILKLEVFGGIEIEAPAIADGVLEREPA